MVDAITRRIARLTIRERIKRAYTDLARACPYAFAVWRLDMLRLSRPDLNGIIEGL